jgi:hypothetical protein
MKFTLFVEEPKHDDFPEWKSGMTFECDTLDDALMFLDMFLHAAGFVYTGELTISEDEHVEEDVSKV